MNYTVYEGRESVGEIVIESYGLYFEIACRVISRAEIRRIYAICGKDSICLGIPDKDGVFKRRIPVKRLPKPDRIIASSVQSEYWHPWSGDYFGPMVYDAFLKPNPNGYSIAIDPDEWENISQWRTIGEREMVGGRSMIRVDIGSDGQLHLTEKEKGEDKHEIHIKNRSNDIDPLLLADLPADYDYGGPCAEEAHSDYL